MVSTSKIPKLSEELNVKKCEERISKLPCNLISHILSYLSTKYAVATCVLSTSWKQSWTLINSLDFDDRLLLNPQESDKTPSFQTSFTSFVFRVLLLRRVSCLSKFHLHCSQSYDSSYVNAWVAATLLSNVQELHLSVPMQQSTVLPQDLFSCGTLLVLKLYSNFVVTVPTLVHLPNLKVLHLSTIKFFDDSINRLICGCPVLEELSMRECLGNGVRSVNILAPVLTSQLCSKAHKAISHLVEACIYIQQGNLQLQDYSEGIEDLLRGISNIQSLYLSMEFMEICGDVDLGIVWAMLPKLLENSPRLGTLVFDEGGWDEFPGQRYPRGWNPPESVPSCLLFHLKEIEITSSEGGTGKLNMVEYFLSNAEVLEKVTIRYVDSGKVWTIRNTQ